ncbi:MAG: site-2 protease family protein [Zetaproteobacteria bacterium]|nr:site-2 protease family protein [Pseudobdellovibrionaceae bacterium]|tara:strand:- start:317 stop:934 length:618 start_codon:yes stop_codon:yes gene_type:complete
MLFQQNILTILIVSPMLIMSLSFHEWAHAYSAYKLGDNTAKDLGRMTINPWVHLDGLGCLMLLLLGFGWAKPVPVSIQNLKEPHTDMIKVALAGPLANFFLAFLGGLLVKTLDSSLAQGAFFLFTQLNIALALFNLLPVAPLDGSQILTGLLIKSRPSWVFSYRKYSPFILYAFIFIGFATNFSPVWWLIGPVVKFLTSIFVGLV